MQRLTHLAAVMFLTGCGTAPQADYSKVKLVAVSGTVTLDGDPVSHAIITFDDVRTGGFSYAQTDSSGRYELQFDSVMSGATAGDKIVQISTARRLLGVNQDDDGGGAEESGDDEDSASVEDGGSAETGTERIPQCYRGPESQLRVTVRTSAATFDFDLKSDCSTKSAAP